MLTDVQTPFLGTPLVPLKEVDGAGETLEEEQDEETYRLDEEINR